MGDLFDNGQMMCVPSTIENERDAFIVIVACSYEVEGVRF